MVSRRTKQCPDALILLPAGGQEVMSLGRPGLELHAGVFSLEQNMPTGNG